MRIFKNLIALAGVAVLLLAGCTTKEQEVAVTGVTLSPTTLTLAVGESQSLTAEVQPSSATNKKINWSTSDPDMKIIALNGSTVKGIGAGSATVIVTTEDGGRTATCQVTVKEGETPGPGPGPGPGKVDVTSVSLALDGSNSLAPGETVTVTATVTPADATEANNIAWSSSNTEVATVAGNGKTATITAVAAGTATITATVDGKSATVDITVAVPANPVKTLSVTPETATIGIDEEVMITAKMEPLDADNIDQLQWTLGNSAVASLTVSGSYAFVKGVSAGTTTLTAAVGSLSATATITVEAAPEVGGLVDLGLPSGTLWCTENLGTDSANPRGLYFAWGEVEPKSSYTWDNYKFGDPISKYNNEDGLSLLESEDDAATVLLGQDYHTPTLGEWAELMNPANCSLEWTSQDGINGILLTSVRNGKTLFLPSTGWFEDDVIHRLDEGSFYWTSTCSGSSARAYEFRYGTFYSSPGIELLLMQRRYGQAVRPVYAPRPTPSTGITVPQETIEVEKGKTYQLTASVQPASAPQTVVWETDSDNIELNYWTGEVVLKSGNGAVVYAFDGTGGHKATITLKVKATYPVPEAVDLGLKSGTKWASWDLGASAPEEPGYQFAWGEIDPKASFYLDNYKWYDSTSGSFTRYDKNDPYLYPEDDAATVHLGEAWRIPSRAQVEELIQNSSMVETEINGMKGQLVTGPNLNTIFLPYGGYIIWNTLYDFGAVFSYQINEIYNADYSWYWFLNTNGLYTAVSWFDRQFSNCIRAVQPGGTKSVAQAVRELGPVGFGKKAVQRQQPRPLRNADPRPRHNDNRK